MINRILELRRQIRKNQPLIHCITNLISINDCANAVLAVGAKPIMAEHPRETAGITEISSALAVNLGNITDARMESILISGRTAARMNIPHIIDAVGVTCSPLRLELAREYIRETTPWIIKGNISEIKKLCGIRENARGIDAGEADAVSPGNISGYAALLQDYACKTGAVILASGKIDLICSPDRTVAVQNGTPMLSRITGTGCMLNVITGAYLAGKDAFSAAVLGCVVLGVAGELAETTAGTGSFHVALLDRLYSIADETIREKIKAGEIQ